VGLTIALGALAALSIVLLGWQVLAASRFPLHQRGVGGSSAPPLVILKPLKGADAFTAECLRSWMSQQYRGELRFFFGVASADDPACDIVRTIVREFPSVLAELVIAAENLGANAKVSNLIQLFRNAERAQLQPGTLVCVSDADVRVPPDFLANSVPLFGDDKVGLVTSFYRLANPATFAMRVEAAAVNADFWSQVLQSNMMKPQAFALGRRNDYTRQPASNDRRPRGAC
jgi:ceramide glucosyltransferase